MVNYIRNNSSGINNNDKDTIRIMTKIILLPTSVVMTSARIMIKIILPMTIATMRIIANTTIQSLAFLN